MVSGSGYATRTLSTMAMSPGPCSAPSSAALALIEPPPDQWDAFVNHHQYGHLLQQHSWGTLKSAFGWTARRLAVVASTPPGMPRILAGAQLLVRRRYGLAAGYIPRGPLWSGDPAVDQLLLEGLHRMARRYRAIFLRLEPGLDEYDPAADQLHSWLLTRGLHPVEPLQPHSTIHLDLTRSEELIFAGFSKGHRADIKRAERQGVQVRTGTQVDLPAFYQIMQATGKRAAFGIHNEAYYRQAWELFQPRSRLLLAEIDGTIGAAHLVFAGPHHGLYLYGGASEAGLKAGANHLLQWAAIRWMRELACPTYDLWGIPDPLGQAARCDDEQERTSLEAAAQHDPLIGVYRFKKGFGGTIVRYLPAYDYVYFSPLYRLWRQQTSF